MSDLVAGAVTIADLYRELVGMRSDLTRVLTHQEAIDVRNVSADQIHTDVEARLRVLERFRYTLVGVCIVTSGASGYVCFLLGHAAR